MSKPEYLREEPAWTITTYDGMYECPICGNYYQPCNHEQDICDECEESEIIGRLRPQGTYGDDG